MSETNATEEFLKYLLIPPEILNRKVDVTYAVNNILFRNFIIFGFQSSGKTETARALAEYVVNYYGEDNVNAVTSESGDLDLVLKEGFQDKLVNFVFVDNLTLRKVRKETIAEFFRCRHIFSERFQRNSGYIISCIALHRFHSCISDDNKIGKLGYLNGIKNIHPTVTKRRNNSEALLTLIETDNTSLLLAGNEYVFSNRGWIEAQYLLANDIAYTLRDRNYGYSHSLERIRIRNLKDILFQSSIEGYDKLSPFEKCRFYKNKSKTLKTYELENQGTSILFKSKTFNLNRKRQDILSRYSRWRRNYNLTLCEKKILDVLYPTIIDIKQFNKTDGLAKINRNDGLYQEKIQSTLEQELLYRSFWDSSNSLLRSNLSLFTNQEGTMFNCIGLLQELVKHYNFNSTDECRGILLKDKRVKQERIVRTTSYIGTTNLIDFQTETENAFVNNILIHNVPVELRVNIQGILVKDSTLNPYDRAFIKKLVGANVLRFLDTLEVSRIYKPELCGYSFFYSKHQVGLLNLPLAKKDYLVKLDRYSDTDNILSGVPNGF